MPTPKELRSAPPKNLDNYFASFRVLLGEPNSIPDDKFPENQFVAKGEDPNAEILSYKLRIPLGFVVNINNFEYSTASVTAAGWMMLDDLSGNTGATWHYDVIDPGFNLNRNDKISSGPWRYKHILLAPWFDKLIPIAKDVDSLQSTTYYTSQLTTVVVQNIKEGRNLDNWPINARDRGTRYARGYDENYGRFFAVRWTASDEGYRTRKRKFDSIVFENGRIEFRYWPIEDKYIVPDAGIFISDPGSTVGVFYNGTKENNFRDFAPILGYDTSSRNLSELGGSPYDPLYTENLKPYSSRIDREIYWPKSGATLVFSPPVNSSKFLPRKINQQIGLTNKLSSEGGRFDDQKIIQFSPSRAYMPSGLPDRHTGEPGAVDAAHRQVLFTNGSIVIENATISKSATTNMLFQADVESASREHKNLSFNEHSKYYETIVATEGFYSSGSALEKFGDGFTTPLKSKTQFHLELPVKNPVQMPALTSSFYHYNSKKMTWEMANPEDKRVPEWTSVDPAVGEVDSVFYNKVTEVAIGFDPVGRRTVLESTRDNIVIPGMPYPESYQRGDTIGVIVNTKNIASRSIVKEALHDLYPSSISDSVDYFPTEDQQISVGNEYPFLVEKIVAEFPFHAYGDWFDDKTTCMRAYGRPKAGGPPYYYDDKSAGPVDFGGPGLTVSVFCARRCLDKHYVDLISSGTITHTFDNKSEVLLRYEDVPSEHPVSSMRPEGFRSFSNPTTVIQGELDPTSTFYEFQADVRVEMEAAVSCGTSYAFNYRSPDFSLPTFVSENSEKAIKILTDPFLNIDGTNFSSYEYNTQDVTYGSSLTDYKERSPRIYIQQVTPLSRGATGVNFNGNSILGGSIMVTQEQNSIANPLFVAESEVELPVTYKDKIADSNFAFDAVAILSNFSSRPSPYLLMPGDKLTVSISKNRPVSKYYGVPTISGPYEHYDDLYLTGSHSNVYLNTGSIKITLFGSYVREGEEYNP